MLKTDGLIAGVHFFPDDPADNVARKALRVNLSDLAAKGAAPFGFLLSIALPTGFSEDWLAEFARGLDDDAENYRCPLLGGDTDSTPGPISISISAFGTLPLGTMVRRSGAQAGDHVLGRGAPLLGRQGIDQPHADRPAQGGELVDEWRELDQLVAFLGLLHDGGRGPGLHERGFAIFVGLLGVVVQLGEPLHRGGR